MSRETDAKSVQEPAQQAVVKTIHEGTKFFRGKWGQKANPLEIETVRLSVNGEWLQWQRGVMTIVPEPYLSAAKNCTTQKFTQNPGAGRKQSSLIPRFTFEIDTAKPEASYAEFNEMFRSGTQKQRAAVAQHGLNIPVEQVIPQAG